MSRTLRELAAIAGLGLLGYGTWLLSPPAALILIGILLLTGAVVGHLR